MMGTGNFTDDLKRDAIAQITERGCGMFLQSVMIGARGHGLDTCPQAAIANYPDIVKSALGIPAEQTIVCGMALGFADADERTNALNTSRCIVDEFVSFHG